MALTDYSLKDLGGDAIAAIGSFGAGYGHGVSLENVRKQVQAVQQAEEHRRGAAEAAAQAAAFDPRIEHLSAARADLNARISALTAAPPPTTAAEVAQRQAEINNYSAELGRVTHALQQTARDLAVPVAHAGHHSSAADAADAAANAAALAAQSAGTADTGMQGVTALAGMYAPVGGHRYLSPLATALGSTLGRVGLQAAYPEANPGQFGFAASAGALLGRSALRAYDHFNKDD